LMTGEISSLELIKFTNLLNRPIVPPNNTCAPILSLSTVCDLPLIS
jgi:hypothetical protein